MFYVPESDTRCGNLRGMRYGVSLAHRYGHDEARFVSVV